MSDSNYEVRLARIEQMISHVVETVDDMKKKIDSVSEMRTDIVRLQDKDQNHELRLQYLIDELNQMKENNRWLRRTIAGCVITGVILSVVSFWV